MSSDGNAAIHVTLAEATALGTAAGDLAAEGLGLGFATAVLIFCALIALTALEWADLG